MSGKNITTKARPLVEMRRSDEGFGQMATDLTSLVPLQVLESRRVQQTA